MNRVLDRRLLAVVALSAIPACRGDVPTEPSPASSPSRGTHERVGGGGGSPSGLSGFTPAVADATVSGRPRGVFKLQPRPDESGLIAGDSPFDVHFNLCRSEDPDGDRLLFTIDADGDGRMDEIGTHGGHCRLTFRYIAEEGEVRAFRPQMCVVDLDSSGRPQREPECRAYAVHVAGPPSSPATCAAPAPRVTGWLMNTSSVLATITCTCAVDGSVIPYYGSTATAPPVAGSFAARCLSNGGMGFGGTAGGTCRCV